MPTYNYICRGCRAEAERLKGAELEEGELPIFETVHGMNPTPRELHEATECPVCLGHDTERTLLGIELTCWVRGYGYSDKAGINRDMNLYKLTGKDEQGRSTDPYKEHRVVGEAEDLKLRLQRGGKRPKNPKYYLMDG